MKDFCDWLGVNEKVAKLVVWIFIGMCMLIIFNTALESFGLPFYKISLENLSKLTMGKYGDYLLSCSVTLLNFYTMIFLVFRLKDFKKIFPYSILYLVLNIVSINLFSNDALNNISMQIFIPLYVIVFSFLYSKCNWKYFIYGLFTYIVNVFMQFICYLYKLRFVDFTNISQFNRFLTSIDFLLIMFVIILIKEIIIKNKEKRKEV